MPNLIEKLHRYRRARRTQRGFTLIELIVAIGVSVILISHRLQDIFTVCDRVMVLRSGECVAERPIGDISMDETVKYIVGAEAGNLSAIAGGR